MLPLPLLRGPRPLPAPRIHALAVLAAAAFLLGAAPARAVLLTGDLAPASQIVQGGVAAPLVGTLVLDVGAPPPVASNTALALVALTASGAGLSITLDDGLANPGLGVLFPGGTFLIPSLHLSVDGQDLTLSDVAGTFGASAACGGATCLETQLLIDPGAGGLVTVDVVALVPEPCGLVLATLGLSWFAVALYRGRNATCA